MGCKVPIQQAGMGDVSSPRLAAAVADAGALGMVGLTNAPLSYVEESLDEMRKMTSGVFGANFLIPGLVDDATGKVDPEFAGVVEAAASRARVVDFFYGDPDPALVDAVHAGGALVSWQVGSRDEA
ncbi:MAG: nitronate monooxygenase, partial [Methanobacteriota archaeon]